MKKLIFIAILITITIVAANKVYLPIKERYNIMSATEINKHDRLVNAIFNVQNRKPKEIERVMKEMGLDTE